MMQQLKLHDTLLLLIIIGSLLLPACSLILKPLDDPATAACSFSDTDNFMHCFGNPGEGRFISIEGAGSPGESGDCHEFQFIGWGTGFFEDIGEVWSFTGSLSTNNEIGVTFTTESGDYEGALQRENETAPLTIRIQTDPAQRVDDIVYCPLLPDCTPHENGLLSGCFQHETISGHWLELRISESECNRVQGRLHGIFADFEPTGVDFWEFDGAVIGPNRARLRVIAEGTERTLRSMEIGRSFSTTPLHLVNGPEEPAHEIVEDSLNYSGGAGECP